MKLIIGLIILVVTTSCSLVSPSPRYNRYEDCVVRLQREGVRSSDIRILCAEAHGSIVDKRIF